MRATLVTGQRKDGVYFCPSSVPLSFLSLKLSSSLSSTRSLAMWHCHLGHLSLYIFRRFLSNLNLSFTKERLASFSYNSCNIKKSHKLPFSTSIITSAYPLDVIYYDGWSSPVQSLDSFKYYDIFIDHFMKYIWLYPLHKKIDTYSTFVTFKSLVENYFSKKIETMFINNGGEYLALKSFLLYNGITHLTTLPIHRSTMATLNADIVTLSTPVSPFSTKPTFHSPFDHTLLLRWSTS